MLSSVPLNCQVTKIVRIVINVSKLQVFRIIIAIVKIIQNCKNCQNCQTNEKSQSVKIVKKCQVVKKFKIVKQILIVKGVTKCQSCKNCIIVIIIRKVPMSGTWCPLGAHFFKWNTIYCHREYWVPGWAAIGCRWLGWNAADAVGCPAVALVGCPAVARHLRRLDVLTPDLGRGGSGRPTVLAGKSQLSGLQTSIYQLHSRDLILCKLELLGVETLKMQTPTLGNFK